MIIDNNQQDFNSYQTDYLENKHDAAGDSKHRLKNKLLADEICRLLFEESTTLLDDIFSHPLSIDYFNVYLSLPIFGQRVFCHRTNHELDFDPPLLPKRQTCEQIHIEAKEWLINFRLNNYIHTDIYIECLLVLLLTKINTKSESSSNLHVFLSSKETLIEEQSYIFSTVTDVRQFHQFLQSTSGIKYWNFFLDSMRLLQFRHSLRSNRIDISYLNFIYKYYSHQHEFPSITIDLNHTRMPDSTTADAIWFQMAINAMYQLRNYWLPRYLSQIFLPSRSKIKYPLIKSHSNQINKLSSENIIQTSSSHHSNTDSIINESQLIKYTLDNISYIDYNPQQYILVQSSSEEHDFQQNTEEINESNAIIDTDQVDKDCKIKFEDTKLRSSDRSIEDYATEDNIELFYRILVSDSLAGSPFSEFMSQTISKTDVTPYQTCIHFITDAEILLSIPSRQFKEKILKQFILRYLDVTTIEKLPKEIFDLIEEQRIDFIQELIKNDNTLLWKILLKITKFLIPHFLNYIKFDRLRFLLQGKSLNTNVIIDDLRHRFPLVNFDTFLTDQQNTKDINLIPLNFNETEFISRSNLINCAQQSSDLLNSFMKNNQYNTTEKLINTDEQCEFRPIERFPPLTDDKFEQELSQLCTKFQWKDKKTILGKSFNIKTILHPVDNSLSHKKIKQILNFDNNSKLNSIETFTLDIMNSAREKFEIENFISNVMNESLQFFQTMTDRNSSPLSPIFEEILLTDSSSITSLKFNTNNNALESKKENITLQRTLIETKILSSIGSYFINSPNITNFSSQSILISKSKNNLTNNYQSIKFAQKDASNEVKTLLFNKPISSSQNPNQQQLYKFIQNHIHNHQWPLEEYIGFKGHRAWRALKLAADISNFDCSFMLNYHNDLDWISIDENFGSFGEQNYLILRNFNRRIEQQKGFINKNYK